jgi:hypothetical protein
MTLRSFFLFTAVSRVLWAQDAAVPEPYKADFNALELGKLPSDMMVVDGEFEIKVEGSGKALAMKAEPLTDGTVLVGKSVKHGGSITAKIKASSVKRRHPKFGLSLGGTSGFRLKVAVAEKLLEITKEDERKATVPLDEWKSGEWIHLELRAQVQADGKWLVEGFFWPETGKKPEKATVTFLSEEALPTGKAGLVAAPFSGTEILFDDVVVTPFAEKKP